MSGEKKDRGMLPGAGRGRYGEGSEPAKDGRADVEPMGEGKQDAERERHVEPDTVAVEGLADASSRMLMSHYPEKNGENNDVDPEDVGGEVGVFDEGFKVVLVHEADVSLFLTVWLLGMFVLCALQGGFSAWWQLAVLVGGYGAMFVFMYLDIRQSAGSLTIGSRTMFVESRAAVAMVGVGAVLFGSPVLVDVVPDIIAVACVFGGIADGYAVGLVARAHGCSAIKAVSMAIGASRVDAGARP